MPVLLVEKIFFISADYSRQDQRVKNGHGDMKRNENGSSVSTSLTIASLKNNAAL